jgi:sigma-E factor negative regulatory protein RseB
MIRACALLLALAAGGVAAAAPETPEAWVAHMAEALATREYEGVFVYIHDGRIDTMRVVRTIGPEGARDALTSLNGEPREVVREQGELRSTGNGVTTVLPSGPSVVFGVAPSALLDAATHYRLAVAGQDRVAGYPVVIVDARPADTARYGYRLWIERDSGMLLRSLLAGPDGTPLEQLMFTSLELRPGRAAETPPAAAADPATLEGPRYREPMPAGFRLVAIRPEQNGRRHFVYTDGLANVSVYVEPLAPALQPITGGLRRGAINLYGHVAGERQIVVVGDVPVNTAHQIAVTLDPASIR